MLDGCDVVRRQNVKKIYSQILNVMLYKDCLYLIKRSARCRAVIFFSSIKLCHVTQFLLNY